MSALEQQLRELYGRVVYTHKTHELMADSLDWRNRAIKNIQIILSALVSVGLLGILLSSYPHFPKITAIISFLLLALNLYMREHDLAKLGESHKKVAVKLWNVRENYLSVLTDLSNGSVDASSAINTRNNLQAELEGLYQEAPRTNLRAYLKAQKRLKVAGDMTFSDKEIDAFLPAILHRDVV